MNYDKDNLLADRDLRAVAPPSKACGDPMHVLLSQGVFGAEVFGLIKALKDETVSQRRARGIPSLFEVLENFVAADWQFSASCKVIGSNLKVLFSALKEKKPSRT